MKWLEIVKQVFVDGGPSTCQFAITNVCNAACDFCSFSRDRLPTKSGKSVPLEDALRAIDILYSNGVRFLVVTGGEPMVHRHCNAILKHAKEVGMTTMMVSNGSVFSERSIDALAETGLSGVIISIDAPDVEAHEHNRGLSGVCEKIKTGLERFRHHKIGCTASVTCSRLIKTPAKLPEFLRDLGFEAVTFSFPLTALESSYLGAADSDLVTFSKAELHDWIETVKGLKRDIPVLNPTASLDDMHAHLDERPQRFECLGGWKQFYLDWNLYLWRCNSWNRPMCHIFEFDGSQKIRDGCQSCMVDCFRDASVQQHVAVSVADAVASLRRGKISKAAKQIFTRENAASINSVLETSFWLARV